MLSLKKLLIKVLREIKTLNTSVQSLQTITEGSGTIGTNTNIANATLKRCTFLKFGSIVFVNLMLYTSSTSATFPINTNLFTAPTGFRPSSNVMVSGTCTSGGSTQSTLFSIYASNGEIQQRNFNNCTMVQLSAIYRI